MLVWLLIGLVVVWSINFARDKDADARFKYGNEVAEFLDVKSILKESYDGSFAFGETQTNAVAYQAAAEHVDAGAVRRLGLHLSRRVPKWVLKTAAKEIGSGTFKEDANYSKYIMTAVEEFSKARKLQIAETIKAKNNPKSQTNARRRRRR